MTTREIGERIRITAKEKGISLTFLCAQIGVNKGYLKDLGNGRGKITDERIAQVAEILDTTVEYLRGETDEKNKPAPETENEPIVDDEGINLLIQFYKFFSEDGQKQLMQKAFDIWQEERSNKQ